jgi:fluoroacetyl-CoA thioesterase
MNMKDTIRPGLETTTRFTVDAARVTRHMGEDLGVYATPALLQDIERTCRNLLQEHLDEGEDTVGTRVDLQHLAAALEGMEVTLHVRVTGVDRRAVTLEITARDEFDELARCTHNRFVVDKAKIKQRLEAKAAEIRGKR